MKNELHNQTGDSSTHSTLCIADARSNVIGKKNGTEPRIFWKFCIYLLWVARSCGSLFLRMDGFYTTWNTRQYNVSKYKTINNFVTL